jgi:predicted RNase H-like HicB family nuclease
VSECDVSSFGETIDGAITNLKEAVELYFEGAPEETQYQQIGEMLIGEDVVNA